MIKTKTISTLGPASDNQEIISALIDNGVDIFRLNFSHGTLDSHSRTLGIINNIRSQSTRTIGVIGDLCGPKIRTSDIDKSDTSVKAGQEIIIEPSIEKGTAKHFGTNYKNICQEVSPGERVMIDDGQISLKIEQVHEDKIICTVLIDGDIRSHKGINLPDSDISAPAITERDYECADWAIENDLDFLALSFVRTAEEVAELKKHIEQKNSPIKVVSKIEKPQAIKNIEAIVEISDAILVARGDLGVEMELARVPIIQKQITSLCRKKGKPVIIATQMLQSMIDSPTPTRAEVSDVSNAIMDFTDAVMLSGETAVGKYPLTTVRTIQKIAGYTEDYMDQTDYPRPRIDVEKQMETSATIARSVAQIIDETNAILAVTWSQAGKTSRLLSKARLDVPVISFSSSQKICNQMTMDYGTIAICHEKVNSLQEFISMSQKLIIDNNWATKSDTILIVAGSELTGKDNEHAIILHIID